jgi:hypothetical protein
MIIMCPVVTHFKNKKITEPLKFFPKILGRDPPENWIFGQLGHVTSLGTNSLQQKCKLVKFGLF